MGRAGKRQKLQTESQQAAGDDTKQAGEGAEGELAFPPRVLLALHPQLQYVAVAAGPDLRVWDTKLQQQCMLKLENGDGEQWTPTSIIRCLAASPDGLSLIVAGDDKKVHVFDTSTWTRRAAYVLPKKASAACFTLDGQALLVADRFGEVYTAATQAATDPGAEPQIPTFAFGHWNGIVNRLLCMQGPRAPFLVSVDRDGKARVTVQTPGLVERGAPLIQSLCLGHKGFVMDAAALTPPSASPPPGAEAPQLLVTGGGDSCLKLWNPMDGTVLYNLPLQSYGHIEAAGAAADGGAEAAADDDGGQLEHVQGNAVVRDGQEAQQEGSEGAEQPPAAQATAANLQVAVAGDGMAPSTMSNGHEKKVTEDASEAAAAAGRGSEEDAGQQAAGAGDEVLPAVLCIAPHPTQPLLAVCLEGCPSVLLVELECVAEDSSSGSLQLAVRQELSCPRVPIPCYAVFDNGGRLWVASGPFAASNNAVLLTVAAPRAAVAGNTVAPPQYGEEAVDKGTAATLQFLQGAGAAEVLQQEGIKLVQVSKQMRKKYYTEEERAARKARRNDRRLREKQATARQQQEREATNKAKAAPS